ncbi:MAG: hypothetical protein IJG39_01340 [Synergistaceae bacterium]|nr:hypothetical protein [Synergistaceae bacterium]
MCFWLKARDVGRKRFRNFTKLNIMLQAGNLDAYSGEPATSERFEPDS